MCLNRFAAAVGVSAVLALGSATTAGAADMPLKAPPQPASPFVLDVHGGVDFTVANTRITGRRASALSDRLDDIPAEYWSAARHL